jgi:hypothetical protein
MPVAIHTRYLPATDTRPSRVKASTHRGSDVVWSVTIPYDYEGREHERAADALRLKHWPALPMVHAGATIDGRGDVYVVGL